MGKIRLPISVRLTLWYALSMAFFLVIFASLWLASLHWSQHIQIHQRLYYTQGDMMQRVQITEGRPAFSPPLSTYQGPLEKEGEQGLYIRLLSPEGAVWDQTPNFEGESFLAPRLPTEQATVEIQQHWHHWPIRTMYVPVLDKKGNLVGWLEVSSHTFAFMLGPTVKWVLLTIFLSLVGGYLLARRALKPVAQLTEAANRITASDLSVRLPSESPVQDELTDLAETFNTMLDRLETAFARERRFTANAAHELMNPLAAIRSEAEVSLRRARDANAYQQALGSILDEATRLGTIVEQLLALARLDSQAGNLATEIDLCTLCADRCTHWQTLAPQHSLSLQQPPAPVYYTGHPLHFATLLDNLLENAIKYTPTGGSIEVHLSETNGEVRLVVQDTGYGFDATTAHHLFDRFYRADMPDVQAQPGSGLGLPIAQAIVHRYNGKLIGESLGLHQGSTFTVRLPR